MKIVEEFETLQGEGKYLGVPSYFIRTTGCNLRCAWENPDKSVTICDTPYTSFKPEKGENLDIRNTLEKLSKTNTKHIVITGGEPTLQMDLGEVVKHFNKDGYTVTIETNSTIYRDDILDAFLSLSPKLKSSYAQPHRKDFNLHSANNRWSRSLKQYINKTDDYQVKFVVNGQEDLKEIIDVQQQLNITSSKIYLMPQGITTEQFREKQQWMFEECIKYGYNYSPRMHMDVWGNKRGV